MSLPFAIVLLAAALAYQPAEAQLVTPGMSHYAAAYDSIAGAKAYAHLAELDAADTELNRQLALGEVRRLAADAHTDKVMRLWADYMQLTHNLRQPWPGDGWHEKSP